MTARSVNSHVPGGSEATLAGVRLSVARGALAGRVAASSGPFA
jgi:hypothetical protein